jgi:hypothetical protein
VGHQRLGRLPRTLRWRQVVQLLDRTPDETSAVAAATLQAADNRLRQLGGDPSLTYCFWLLTRISWAARGTSFASDLQKLGIAATPDATAMTLIAAVADRVRREQAEEPSAGQFSELASLALRRALTETVGEQGRSLFGSSAEDVQRGFRTYSTKAEFGVLAHRFFADFMARTLRSFVDRELSNRVQAGAAISGVAQSGDFMDALDRHTRQAARIVEEFAGGWYSKHNWQARGEITREETGRFVAYAMRKLRSELKRGSAEP